MNRAQLLKIRIKALHEAVQFLGAQLEQQRYYAGLKASESPVIIALADELEEIKKAGREAVFDLLISVSHRQFMKFIKEL